MKTIIFSDTHLTARLEPDKFAYLVKILRDADKVIINGDFWDCYDTDFDTFMQSDWKKLFPLLKQKKAIYLFGNHDPELLMDDRIKQFCSKAQDIYKFKQNKYEFVVRHGHRIVPSYVNDYPWLVNPVTNLIRNMIQSIGTKLFGYKYYARRGVSVGLFLLWCGLQPGHTIYILSARTGAGLTRSM